MISPCINIGIGKDGKACVESLASIFHTRETLYPKLMSFYAIQTNEPDNSYYEFNPDYLNFSPYEFNSKVDDSLTLDHILLASAYNDLISILNVLFKDLQYSFININLIYSALEQDLSIIESINDIVKSYTEQGIFGTAIVKNYVFLSDGTGIVSTSQGQTISRNLHFLQQQKTDNTIVDSIFLLDDKNIDAVFLGYEHSYLSFALYEFFISMMTNEYKLLSNLPNRNNFLSFGLGSVFFDQLYFDLFFDQRIFKALLKQHAISTEDKNSYNLKDLAKINKATTDLYLDPKADLSALLDFVNPQSDQLNVGSYNYIIELLLGIRSCVVDDKENFDLRYNLKDLIFTVIYNHILENKEDYISTQQAKDSLVESHFKKYDLADLKKGIQDKQDQEEIQEIQDTIAQNNQTVKSYKEQIDKVFREFKKPSKRKNLKLADSQLTYSINELTELQDKKKVIERTYRKKNCIARFFSKGAHNQELDDLEVRMESLQNKVTVNSVNTKSIEAALNSLYDLYDSCLKNHNRIQSLRNQLNSYGVSLSNSKAHFDYIDHSFIHNILDKEQLRQYFKTHKADLLQGSTISICSVLDQNQEISEIKNNLIDKLQANRKQIIDFKIDDYMQGHYNNLNLFKVFDYDQDIPKLLARSKCFINVIPTYTIKSHELFSLYEHGKNRKHVLNKLGSYYNASIPQPISNSNKDRFISIHIENLDSLMDIAKINIDN